MAVRSDWPVELLIEIAQWGTYEVAMKIRYALYDGRDGKIISEDLICRKWDEDFLKECLTKDDPYLHAVGPPEEGYSGVRPEYVCSLVYLGIPFNTSTPGQREYCVWKALEDIELTGNEVDSHFEIVGHPGLKVDAARYIVEYYIASLEQHPLLEEDEWIGDEFTYPSEMIDAIMNSLNKIGCDFEKLDYLELMDKLIELKGTPFDSVIFRLKFKFELSADGSEYVVRHTRLRNGHEIWPNEDNQNTSDEDDDVAEYMFV